MATVSEIYEMLDELLPRSLSLSWDNDGLMVCPDPDTEVHTILFALDITDCVVEYAKEIGAELIISHHPLIFYGLKHMDGKEATSRKVIELIKNGIAAMSFHTRLDAAEGGINDLLAEIFELSNVESFGVEGDTTARVGNLPEEMSFEDFCELVKEKLDAPVITAAKASETVSRLALLGGGGKDYIYAAKETGADAYLTGEASYNAILDGGENGISVIAAGHYHTEWQFREFFKKALGDDFEYVDFPLGYELYHA